MALSLKIWAAAIQSGICSVKMMMLRLTILAVLLAAAVQGQSHPTSLTKLESQLSKEFPEEWRLQLQNVFQRFQQIVDGNEAVNLTAWQIVVNTVIDTWREEMVHLNPNPERELPPDSPLQLRSKVDEVFEDLQSSLDRGEQLDVQDAYEEIVEKVREMWERFSSRVQGSSRPSAQKSRLETLPKPARKPFSDYFKRMQEEVEAERSLELKDWHDELQDLVQDLYTKLKTRMMMRTDEETTQSFPDKVPNQVTQPITDMFRRMQNEVYSGTALDVSAYYDEVINTHVDKLWDMFATPGRNNGPRLQMEEEEPEFEVICRGEGYEARQYHRSMLATATVLAPSYDDAVAKCTPILLKYMRGHNIENIDLGKTLPLSTRVQRASERNQRTCEQARYTCFVMIPSGQENAPSPRDPRIRIDPFPSQVVFTTTFQGFVTDIEMWAQLERLVENLDAAGESYNEVMFHVDVFNNPWQTLNRRNEIHINMKQGVAAPACSRLEPEVGDPSRERSSPALETKTECTASRPLGMESGDIENHQITASSHFSINYYGIYFDFHPHNGRLHNTGYWAPEGSNPTAPWIEVDLLQPHRVMGIVTQGSLPQHGGFHEWITELRIRHGEPLEYILQDTEPKTFTANNDSITPTTITFPAPIVTRILRIEPTAWHEWCALRFEILGCPIAVESRQDLGQNAVAPKQDLGQNALVPYQDEDQNNVVPDLSQNVNRNDIQSANCQPGISCPPYNTITRYVDYQERSFSFSRWVCMDISDACNVIEAKTASYEVLQDYFTSSGNMEGVQMTPTIPLTIKMATGNLNQQTCNKMFTSCMYIPEEHQGSPPTPNQKNLYIQDLPAASIKYVYPFTLRPTADKISELAGSFLRTLEFNGASYDGSSAFIAFYSASESTHYSEIWIDK